MNGIDITILVIVGFFGIKGLFRGLVIEIFTLIGLLVGYVIALREMGDLADFLERVFHIPELIANALGFLLIFIFITLLFRWIAGGLRRFLKWTFIGWLDRGSGLLFGLFKGTLITSLLLLLVSLIPLPNNLKEEENGSLLCQPVRSVAPAVFNFLKDAFPRTKDFYEEVKEGFSEKSRDFIDDMKAKHLNAIRKEVERHVEDR
jgi:membrane protein required for colicin V production